MTRFQKAWLAAVTSAVVSGSAGAQPPTKAEALIQACQSLKRQSDRNKCLEEAVRASVGAAKVDTAPVAPAPPQPTNKEIAAKRSEQVFAAALALQSVIDLGVSYNDYRPYIQKLAVELGSYQTAIVFDEEKRAVEQMQLALNAYNDAREYWYADINFYSKRDNGIAYFGSLPMGLAGVSHIVSKYSIPTQKSDIWGLNYGATRSTALATIWQYARSRVEDAKTALSFEQPVEVARDTTATNTAAKEQEYVQGALRTTLSDGTAAVTDSFSMGKSVTCGTVVTGGSPRQFMVNAETKSVYVEGTRSWTDAIWPTFCKLFAM